MGVRREVDHGEWHVTEQTGGGALIQAQDTQVSNNPHRRAFLDLFRALGRLFEHLTLDLEADLDDFQWIGEYLRNGQYLDKG